MDKLLTKLTELHLQEFYIEMADHLDSEDYKLLHEIHEQKTTLIKELKDNYNIDYYNTDNNAPSECLNELYELLHPSK